MNNKENFNENKEDKDKKELPPIKENEDVKEDDDIANSNKDIKIRRHESSDVIGYGKKKSFKFKDLKKSIFGKK